MNFNQAGITCLIKRVLEDDEEQFYVFKLRGLSQYEQFTLEPLFEDGMCKNSFILFIANLERFAYDKIRLLTFHRKTDNVCQATGL